MDDIIKKSISVLWFCGCLKEQQWSRTDACLEADKMPKTDVPSGMGSEQVMDRRQLET